MKKLSSRTIDIIFSAATGAMTVAVMAFSLLAANASLEDDGSARVYLFFVFLCLCLTRLAMALYAHHQSHAFALPFYKSCVFSGFYLLCAILSLAISSPSASVLTVGTIYIGVIGINRVCVMIAKKKLSASIINGILLVLAGLMNLVLAAASGVNAVIAVVALSFSIIALSLIEVLSYAFSRIRLKGLLKIIRETYVLEILYGLIILMISFAFYFSTMEEGFKSFGDGLWYAFATITTIGYGDRVASSTIGRILTAILGIYGIIVTATITSVIVNFYSEMKLDAGKKEDVPCNEGQDEHPESENE